MTLPMWQLYQFPLCPFSRKVRLALTEKAIQHELVRVSPWLQEDEFMDLNPAGQTPVLVERDKGTVLIDSGAICEYFEETIDRTGVWPAGLRSMNSSSCSQGETRTSSCGIAFSASARRTLRENGQSGN